MSCLSKKVTVGKFRIFLTSKDDLQAYFSKFGEVNKAVLALHYKTERFMGFATVEFRHATSVQNVMKHHEHQI